jgi:multiple sugar transport system permease protein
MTAATAATATVPFRETRASTRTMTVGKSKRRRKRVILQIFLIVVALGWLFPLVWAVFASFRDYAYTQAHGYASLGGFTVQNYVNAWRRGEFTKHFINSAIIVVPTVLFTLALASGIGFVFSRFSFRFNLLMLGFFTAANLLPQQALIIPVFRMFREIPVPQFISESGTLLDSFLGLILADIAFQVGFCAFVLSNYMKALPRELYEAAQVDGASVFRQYWSVTLPLCRPALGALAALEVVFIYNEFLLATALLQTGDKFPITSSLNNLRGEFFTDYNLLSAGSVIIAIPTIFVFLILQRQFVRGLTLGATKG